MVLCINALTMKGLIQLTLRSQHSSMYSTCHPGMIHVPTNVFCGASEVRAWHIFQWSWYHHVLSGWAEIPYVRSQPAYGARGRGCLKIHSGSWHLLISAQSRTLVMNNSTSRWSRCYAPKRLRSSCGHQLCATLDSVNVKHSPPLCRRSHLHPTVQVLCMWMYLNEVLYHSTTNNCVKELQLCCAKHKTEKKTKKKPIIVGGARRMSWTVSVGKSPYNS